MNCRVLSRQAWIVAISIVFIAVMLSGCTGTSSGPSNLRAGSSASMSGRPAGAANSKRVSDGMKLLMDSIDKPQAPLHFTYQANENVNRKFPMQAGELPKLGDVSVEADVSPDGVTVTEDRAGKRTETKASKSDPSFGFAKLGVMSCMLEVTFPFAYAGPTAEAAGSDVVGGVPADKFNMDTTTADANTQAALAMVGGMLGGKVKIKSVRGSAWLEKSTGRLVKFDLKADLSSQDGQSWQERYRAEVTPN